MSIPAPATVNVSEVIDHSRLGPFQVAICLLCGLCLIMDGFDVQAMGYVAPAIIREWNIPNVALGPVFGAGLFGVLIGSLVFSMLADKIGRRPVLIAVTLFFSAMTFVTAHAGSVTELLAIRFIAGLGLGGIMPNAVALCGEYSSRAMRVTVMTIVANGFTAGAAIGGFISAWLIPNFGWRSVFYFGAALPLAIAVAMVFWLPESLYFLVLHGKDSRRLAKWLRRVDPGAAPSGAVQYVVTEKKRVGVPVFALFRDGRARGTVLLWIVNFMNLLNLYFLSSWLPTVARDAGRSASTAVLVGTSMQVGGTLAALGLGWFIERFGFIPVLAASFAVAAGNIAMIGYPGLSLVLLFAVVFLAGMGILGGQAAVNALAGTYYPTSLRSTGVGWSLGIGRIGAIVGPVLAGELMALHWSNQRLFLTASVPALISALVILSMRWVIPDRARQGVT
jgi:AAHS family 4-hydroxybenzoate transporter-like MFS transporter